MDVSPSGLGLHLQGDRESTPLVPSTVWPLFHRLSCIFRHSRARPGLPPLQGGLDIRFSAKLLPPPQEGLLAALLELIYCHYPAAPWGWGGAVCQASHSPALPSAANRLSSVSGPFQCLFPSITVLAPPTTLGGNEVRGPGTHFIDKKAEALMGKVTWTDSTRTGGQAAINTVPLG